MPKRISKVHLPLNLCLLTDPFLAQQQQMVTQTPTNLPIGNVGHLLQGASSSSTTILMADTIVGISMQAKIMTHQKENLVQKIMP